MNEPPDHLTPTRLRQMLRNRGLAARKAFGQNFLHDARVLDRICDVAEIGAHDPVLEIGPGPGTLTGYLLSRSDRVAAVEIDRGMVDLLGSRFGGRLRLVEGDFLRIDVEGLMNEVAPQEKAIVVANLPYYITTPVLFRLLSARKHFSRLILMMQREVAERLVAVPGGRDYGSLSVAVQLWGKINLAMRVAPQSFLPVPKVESAVVRIDLFEQPTITVDEPEVLERVARAAFALRRKTVLNSLSHNYPSIDRGVWQAILEETSIDPNRRGETLSLSEFAGLANRVSQLSHGM